jgi:hypothetical protein
VSKKLKHINVLQDLNIDDFKYIPPDCTCASSPFIYSPTGHVITDDFKIIISKRCSPKGLNIVRINPLTGSIALHIYGFRGGLCQTMGRTCKGGHIYSFRMGEECEVAHTD